MLLSTSPILALLEPSLTSLFLSTPAAYILLLAAKPLAVSELPTVFLSLSVSATLALPL